MRQPITKLPTYEEVVDKINNCTDNAIDRFIFHNEPAGDEDQLFRVGLLKVIEFVQSEEVSDAGLEEILP